MFQIDNQKMKLLKPLLNKSNSHYPLLRAIISNKKKGKAYVDNLGTPSVAGVLSDDGWFYLLGENIINDFNLQLKSFLLQKILRDNTSILWFGITEEWKKRMSEKAPIIVRDYPRVQYEFVKSDYCSFILNSDKYQIKEISSENIEEFYQHYKNLYGFWQSRELFIENGLGFILLDSKKIIGHAISASIEDGEVEIDIETDKQYRGKGIARYLASRLIDKCLQTQKTPKWDCSVGNVPSKKLALKLGFKKANEYPFSILSAK